MSENIEQMQEEEPARERAPISHDLGGIFALPESEGYNESERFLAHLCRASFLSLWSLPNTYRAPNKELVDVLLVFGDDVVLFSDKDIALPAGSDLRVTWPRWCRKAIDDSVRQLGRAKSWLERFPKQVFLDRAATREIPVTLPPPSRARYHLVATARGGSRACAETTGSEYGSMVVSTSFPNGWSAELPFHTGAVRHKSGFVHVFDELTIELLLRELDTVSDFVSYLKARESFLSGDRVVIATGEEQLLAAYLTHSASSRAPFLPKDDDLSAYDTFYFDSSHADTYFSGGPYRSKRFANKSSYLWDRLIETFVSLGNPSYVGEHDVAPGEVERALRVMAGESRFFRRILVESLHGLFHLAAQGSPLSVRYRVAASRTWDGTAYVFFVFPKRPNISFDEYRQERKERLYVYCMCLLAKHATIEKVVGLGFDHPLKSYDGSSEDLIMANQAEMTEEQRQLMRKASVDLGILGEGLTETRVRAFEYPQEANALAAQRAEKAEQRKEKKAKKRKRKQAAKSRRSNRS